MGFWNKTPRGRKTSSFKTDEVYIATTTIVSSHDDGSGVGPICVEVYLLVYEVENQYYDIFADKKIEKVVVDNYSNFNTPYISKVEPLKKYLKKPNKKSIELQLLFDFILNMNVLGKLKAFSNTDNT